MRMNAEGTLAVSDRLMVWSSDPQALEQKALATLNATAPDNTGPYGCESFGQEEARPTGSHSLYALDLNGDGILEYPTVGAYLKTSTSEVKQGTRLQENAAGEIDFDAPRIPDNDFVVMNGMMIYHPQEDAQALRNAEFNLSPTVVHP